MVYEPREDSQFLARFVERHARGRVLDVGTGSGIQAFTALQNADVEGIVAVDIDPLAVECVKERIVAELDQAQRRRIVVLRSDLFESLEGELFDTIICNPPYLPDERDDNDPALYGGDGGWEWSVMFLREAKGYLSRGGQILFLFSSLTNKERIDAALKDLGYWYEELGILAMFFERLYVYRVGL